jgi:hypothetical protein
MTPTTCSLLDGVYFTTCHTLSPTLKLSVLLVFSVLCQGPTALQRAGAVRSEMYVKHLFSGI